jgi:flagellar biosynthesis/type III secretory pathway protein FliH
LFNADPLKQAPRHWLDDTWLNSSTRPIQSFGEFDWDNVPKLDYSAVKFRQLATPESARVLDEDSEFKLETFGRTVGFKQDGMLDINDHKPASTVAPLEDSEPPSTAIEPDAQAHQHAHNEDEIRAHQEAQVLREQQRQLERVVFGPDCMWRNADSSALDDWPLGDDTPSLDPAALAAARDQAYGSGYAAGVESGLAQGNEDGYAKGLTEGLQQGIDKAQAEAATSLENALQNQKNELSAVLDDQLNLLTQLNEKINAFSHNPQELFEPLKRLAVHISEQLVLAELTLSGQVIERLVQRCLDEIDLHGQSAITIELNPQDKARLEDLGAEVIKQMQLQAVPSLQPGSVRLLVNDSQIEDLIEHRLQAMANRLLNQPELWREQSAFFRQPLAQREGQVEDATQRVTYEDPPEEDEHA